MDALKRVNLLTLKQDR